MTGSGGPEGEAGRGEERLRRIERSIEERLRRMSEDGELAQLPGEGRPLPLEGLEGPRWAAFHLMKNNRLLPQWAEMRKEIDAESARLGAAVRRHTKWADRRAAELRELPAERILEGARLTREVDDRFRTRLEGELRELNARIHLYNAEVPVDSLRLAPAALDRMLPPRRPPSL